MTGHIERGTAPVSAIIPCYRCARTIDRAVASVATQSRVPTELILVEDGSGDGTLEHLQSLAGRHPPGWIRIVALPENRGAADARNAGWELATQPYVAFLDSDDAWHARKIELQHGFMASRPEVALCAHRHEVLESPGVPENAIDGLSAQAISKLSLLMSNNFFAPTMMMLRRELPYRFLSGRRHVDDHLLWLQIVCAGLPFVRLSAKLAFTYKRPYGESGLSSQLWEMEKAELENYWILRRAGCIGSASALALSALSLGKFMRRVFLVCLWRLGRAVGSRSN
jgi:glycosyltransferase involved in cell wall biosynthesis